MKTFMYFALFLFIAMIAIIAGVIIGDYAPWYFVWIMGTAVIVLVSAASGTFYDTQEAERREEAASRGWR